MRITPSSQGAGQVGPADLSLPPTQPIDITALITQQLASQSASEPASTLR